MDFAIFTFSGSSGIDDALIMAPMLADRGVPAGSLDGWAVEPKLDGWRVTVLVDPGLPGCVVVSTWRGHNVTDMVRGIASVITVTTTWSSTASWWRAPAARAVRCVNELEGRLAAAYRQWRPLGDSRGADGAIGAED